MMTPGPRSRPPKSLIVAAASGFACPGAILKVCPSMKMLSPSPMVPGATWDQAAWKGAMAAANPMTIANKPRGIHHRLLMTILRSSSCGRAGDGALCAAPPARSSTSETEGQLRLLRVARGPIVVENPLQLVLRIFGIIDDESVAAVAGVAQRFLPVPLRLGG